MNRHISLSSIILWLLVVLAFGLILLLAFLPDRKPDVIEDTVEAERVRVLTVAPRNLVQSVTLPGRVTPYRTIGLAAEIGGVLTEVAVEKGDTIEKGQVLLRIDERSWAAQHRQAEVEQRDAARDLERWTRMQAEGAVSQSEFDAVIRRKEMADIALDLATIQLDKARLQSPVNGVVEDRLVEPGSFVNEGQAVLRILELDPRKVVFHVPERDVAMLAKDQLLTIRAPALHHVSFEGKVTFIGRETAPPAFSYPVELLVEDAPESIRPGMIVDVVLDRAVLEDAIAIPLPAVIPRRGEHIVYLYEEGAAVRTVVWIDSFLNGEAVIAGGLKPGDQLIIDGHRTLQDGTPVQIDPSQE